MAGHSCLASLTVVGTECGRDGALFEASPRAVGLSGVGEPQAARLAAQNLESALGAALREALGRRLPL